ncbi:hypothetical protein MRX96_034290 [Rhipicephalus microplus]
MMAARSVDILVALTTSAPRGLTTTQCSPFLVKVGMRAGFAILAFTLATYCTFCSRLRSSFNLAFEAERDLLGSPAVWVSRCDGLPVFCRFFSRREVTRVQPTHEFGRSQSLFTAVTHCPMPVVVEKPSPIVVEQSPLASSRDPRTMKPLASRICTYIRGRGVHGLEFFVALVVLVVPKPGELWGALQGRPECRAD